MPLRLWKSKPGKGRWPEGVPDEDLIREYRHSGNPDLIGHLFNRYMHLVYGVCMKYFRDEEKSNDAVMEIFEGLFEKLRTQEIGSFKNWLYILAKNHCLMDLRKTGSRDKARQRLTAESAQDFMEYLSLVHLNDEPDEEARIQNMIDSLENLRPEQRKCLELMYLEDRSYKEISDVTGFDLNAVKSHIQNGKRNLKILTERAKMLLLMMMNFLINL